MCVGGCFCMSVCLCAYVANAEPSVKGATHCVCVRVSVLLFESCIPLWCQVLLNLQGAGRSSSRTTISSWSLGRCAVFCAAFHFTCPTMVFTVLHLSFFMYLLKTVEVRCLSYF
jgi:hypothetical protein